MECLIIDKLFGKFRVYSNSFGNENIDVSATFLHKAEMIYWNVFFTSVPSPKAGDQVTSQLVDPPLTATFF
jgi:hypothetical protein